MKTSIELLQNLQIEEYKQIEFKGKDEKSRAACYELSKHRQTLIRNFVTSSLEIDKNFFREQTQVIATILNAIQIQTDLIEDKMGSTKKIIKITEERLGDAKEYLQMITQTKFESEEQLRLHINKLKQDIKQINSERLAIANTINTAELAAISLKNKDFESPLIELWKWMLVFLYKDQPSNYYWQNFKQEVFVKDKGYDFKERLSKIKGVGLKIDEEQRTLDVLKSRENMLKVPILNDKQREQIKKIFSVIELIKLSHQKGNEIIEKENKIAIILSQQQQNIVMKDQIKEKINYFEQQLILYQKIQDNYIQIFAKLQEKCLGYKRAKQLNLAHINNLKLKYEVLKKCNMEEYIQKIQEMKVEIQNEFEQYQQFGPGSQQFQQDFYQSINEKPQVISDDQNEQTFSMKKSKNLMMKKEFVEPLPDVKLGEVRGGCDFCQLF